MTAEHGSPTAVSIGRSQLLSTVWPAALTSTATVDRGGSTVISTRRDAVSASQRSTDRSVDRRQPAALDCSANCTSLDDCRQSRQHHYRNSERCCSRPSWSAVSIGRSQLLSTARPSAPASPTVNARGDTAASNDHDTSQRQTTQHRPQCRSAGASCSRLPGHLQRPRRLSTEEAASSGQLTTTQANARQHSTDRSVDRQKPAALDCSANCTSLAHCQRTRKCRRLTVTAMQTTPDNGAPMAVSST